MSDPLVSIIIPAYNSKQFIKETVKSALEQTYKNIEVILVDDGSTDDTEAFFDEFQNQGVNCFRISNGGASNARNFGLVKSKGVYIQFLDADDLLHPTKIEEQISAMINQNAEISFTPWINFREVVDVEKKFIFSNVSYAKPRTGKELIVSFGIDNWFIPTVSWLTHKKLIEKAGNWNMDISNNDDGEFFFRALYYAFNVACVDKVLFYYRLTVTDSLSKMNSTSKIDDAFKSYQLIENFLTTRNEEELLSYPKRLYYTQFNMIKNAFPEKAKRAAKSFDTLNSKSFLQKHKKYWFLVKLLGLYNGTMLFNFLNSVKDKIRTFML